MWRDVRGAMIVWSRNVYSPEEPACTEWVAGRAEEDVRGR